LSKTSFEIEAFDVEARDAGELSGFRKGLAHDSTGLVPFITWCFSITTGGLLVYLSVFATIGPPRWSLGIGLILVVLLGLWSWSRFGRPLDRPRTHPVRFAFRFDPAGLSIAWGSQQTILELAAIDRFEAELAAVIVVRRDGTRQKLPCVMPSRGENEALATKLEGALTAIRTSGGYRGAQTEDVEDDLRQSKA
jgi:hypothetical protein